MTPGKVLKCSHLHFLTCKWGVMSISTTQGYSNDSLSPCMKTLQNIPGTHWAFSTSSMNMIINLILSVQTGFLPFIRDWISNPNSQEEEYGWNCQSRVLQKGQAAVAGPSPSGGKEGSLKAESGLGWWEASKTTPIREGRTATKVKSRESLWPFCVYTIYSHGQIWLLMCWEESDPLGRWVTPGRR